MGSKTILQNEAAFMNLRKSSRMTIENIIVTEFITFWKHYDALYYTNHMQIIEMLYVLTIRPLEQVAFDCNVDDKTLFRYRKKYMDLYLVLCKEHGIES